MRINRQRGKRMLHFSLAGDVSGGSKPMLHLSWASDMFSATVAPSVQPSSPLREMQASAVKGHKSTTTNQVEEENTPMPII